MSGIVPDCLFPSSNELGIPDLLLSMQADYVDLPVKPWGSIARTRTHRGTYHFYVDDYRFEGLWQRPEKVWKTGCVTVVEPNFSTGPDQPRAVAIWQTYRKRWLARYWQQNGVRILVDLNVHHSVEDLNMMGVPLGWRAYATRTHEGDRESKILHEAKLAEIHAESDDILFAVYGHSKWARRACENHGWIFLNQDHWPEKEPLHSDIRRPESLEAWI